MSTGLLWLDGREALERKRKEGRRGAASRWAAARASAGRHRPPSLPPGRLARRLRGGTASVDLNPSKCQVAMQLEGERRALRAQDCHQDCRQRCAAGGGPMGASLAGAGRRACKRQQGCAGRHEGSQSTSQDLCAVAAWRAGNMAGKGRLLLPTGMTGRCSPRVYWNKLPQLSQQPSQTLCPPACLPVIATSA